MRLKTFRAPTLEAAKAEVRRVLGDDPIIAATRTADNQDVEIICSIETDTEQEKLEYSDRPASPRQVSEIARALRWHEVPIDLTDRILYHIAINRGRETTQDTLAATCKEIFSFHPFIEDETRSILLFGPPGMGKTVSIAKLALKLKLQGRKPALLCADHLRTGAPEQLALYAEKLDCPIYHARLPERIEKILNSLEKDITVIIDTPGVNPFARNEISALKKMIANPQTVPIIVMNTLTDSIAGGDLARAFTPMGARHLLITGLDVDRRLGRILSIADMSGLSLSYYSPRPVIVDGLLECNSVSIAELLLSDIPTLGFVATATPEKEKSEAVATEKKPNPKQTAQKNTPLEQDVLPNALAIASGKGGVGKTFLSSTLAHALARQGKKVLLFDADLGLANIDIQLGLTPRKDLGQVFKKSISLQEAVFHVEETGFDVLAGRSGSGRLSSLPLAEIINIWGSLCAMASDYDFILLDLGAGIEQINQFLTTHAQIALVVTNDEPTALTDAYAFLKVIYRQKPDARQYIVVNSASSERQGERTFRVLEQTCRNFIRFEPKLAGIVRQDKHVHNAIRSQTPFLLKWPEAPAAADIGKLGSTVVKLIKGG